MSLHDIQDGPIDKGLLVDAAGSEEAQVRGRRNQVMFFVLLVLPFAAVASGVRNPLAAVAHEVEGAEVAPTVALTAPKMEQFEGAATLMPERVGETAALHDMWAPGAAEAAACLQSPPLRGPAAEDGPEPSVSAAAVPGARVNMPPFASPSSACSPPTTRSRPS